MSGNDVRLRWAHGTCQTNPCFLSTEKACIPCDNFIRICDIDSKKCRCIATPGKGIACISTIPDLAVLAIAEKGPKIHVLQYPSCRVISTIRYGSKTEYVALNFVGLSYLMSVCRKPEGDITLWKWRSGQKLYSVVQSCCYLHDSSFYLTSNPSSWSQLCLQQTMSLTLLDVKELGEEEVIVQQKCLISPTENSDDAPVLQKNGQRTLPLVNGKAKRIRTVCHCWMPDDKIAVACEDGAIMVVGIVDFDITVLTCLSSKFATSLAYNTCGLFVGQGEGYVLWADISKLKWNLLEILKIGQSVRDLTFCPKYDKLLIVSSKGSVFVYTTGQDKIRCLISGDKREIIGVCVIHPDSTYCISARSNGMIQAWCLNNGRLISKAYVDDNVVTLATNPLCPVAVLTTETGFLYFLDVSNVFNIRIVHVIQPYENPIKRVKFDNFGRYAVLGSEDENLSILNACPSTNFRFLGYRKPFGKVHDLSLFTRDESSITYVTLLIKKSSNLCHGVGDLIELFEIPEDLKNDPNKYQTDVFQTLSENALKVRQWSLDEPSSLIALHSMLGVLLYCPISKEIRRFNVWSPDWDTSSATFTKISYPGNSMLCIVVSQDQRYLFCVDYYCAVTIYNSTNLNGLPQKLLSFSNCKYACVIDAVVCENSFVVGSGSGIVACFDYDHNAIDFESLQAVKPMWILRCSELSSMEIIALSEMEEEGIQKDFSKKRLTSKLAVIRTGEPSSWKAEITKTLKLIAISLINLVDREPGNQFETDLPHCFQLNDNDVLKISTENKDRMTYIDELELLRRNFMPSKKDTHSKELSDNRNVFKALMSSLEVTKYADFFEENGKSCWWFSNIKKQSENFDTSVHTSTESEAIPCESIIMMNDVIRNLKSIYVFSDDILHKSLVLRQCNPKSDDIMSLETCVYHIKEEFNKMFDRANTLRLKKIESISDRFYKLQDIDQKLRFEDPAWERSLRNGDIAFLEEREFLSEAMFHERQSNRATFSNETETAMSLSAPSFVADKPRDRWSDQEKQIAAKYEAKQREVTRLHLKTEYTYLKQCIQQTAKEIDLMCVVLNEVKTICNFMIYDVELKILILIIWMMSKQELNALIGYYKRELEELKRLRKSLKTSTEDLSNKVKNTMKLWEVFAHLERKIDHQTFLCCREVGDKAEILYRCFGRRPSLSSILESKEKNPYTLHASRRLSRKDMESCLKPLDDQSFCPPDIGHQAWKAMCTFRVWKLSAEVVLRSQMALVRRANNVLLQWEILGHEMIEADSSIREILRETEALLERSEGAISTVLHNKEKYSKIGFELLYRHLDPTKELDGGLSTSLSVIWGAIRKGTCENKILQSSLEATEKQLGDVRRFREDIVSKENFPSSNQFNLRMTKLSDDLEELEEHFKQKESILGELQNALLNESGFCR